MSKVFPENKLRINEGPVVAAKEAVEGVAYPEKRPEVVAAVTPGMDQLWSFTYKRGPAAYTGVVRAKDQDTGQRVAVEWGRMNGVRVMGGAVKPMILADESILNG